MNPERLLTAAAVAALAAAISGAAWGQPAATAKTEAQAQTATGKPTTDAPANTAVQGTAAAVRQGAAPATGAAPAPAAPASAAGAGYAKIAPSGDIVQTLQASGQFKTFIKGLDATNLTPVLRQQPHLTVFAPTDAAFASYGDVNKLMADLPTLQKLLLHHVINAEVDSTKFKNAHGGVASGAGDKIVLDGTSETFKADQASIVQADVHATNGYINVVDQVLKAGSVPEQIPEAAAPAAEEQTAAPAKAAPATKKSAKGTKRGSNS
jgi:uncharacterized surface protein with fasciclin (FAS1) repeats